MKKTLSIFFAVLGLLLVLIVAVPFLMTWNQYKDLIQSEAYKATGRELVINGDVRLGLLPSPFAKVTDVIIKNPAGATSQNFATVKSLDVGLALLPLLSKKVQVTHIKVIEPAITMEVMANGQNNWNFTPPAKAGDAAPAVASPSAADASTSSLSIDDLTIEKAFLRYIDVPKKSQQMIGPFDGTFKIASLAGPISGKGTVTLLEKIPVAYEMKVDSLPVDPKGSIPFTLDVNALNDAAVASLKGQYNKEDSSARVETAISAKDLQKLLAALNKENKSPDLPPFLKGKISAAGLLQWKDQTATIDNLQINSGGMEITGSLSAALKEQTTVTLDLARVVLPPEMAAQSTASAGDGGGSSDKKESLAQNLEKSFAQAVGLLDTTLPATPLNVVLTATQLPLPGQPTLRDVRLAASTGVKGVTLQNIEAKLPGNTSLQIKGELPVNASGKIDHAKIDAHIVSQNMQAALGKEVAGEAVPINLQTTLLLTRTNLKLQPLQIIQNNQTVQGEVTYDPKTSEALSVALKGDALNLDAFLGSGKKAAAPSATAKTTASQKQKKSDGDPLASLNGLKAHITADLGSVTYQGKNAKNVKLDTVVSDAGLELKQATIGNLGGMTIAAAGTIGKLSPLSKVDISAKAKTPNLSETLRTLGNEAAQNLGASEFNAQATGDADNLKVALNGTIDQGRVAINGIAKQLNATPSFAGSVDISHPETATILRNFGGMKPTASLGAFALKTNVTYGADTLKADDLMVKLGSAGTLQGFVNVTPQENGRKIDAKLTADKLALAALMGDSNETSAQQVEAKAATTATAPQEPWSKEAINLEFLRGLQGDADVAIGELLYKKFVIHNFKTTLSFADNTMQLSQLSGALFDAGNFNVSGQLTPGKETQPHKGAFDIKIQKTDAKKLFEALGSKPFSEGIVDMEEKISFNGSSPYAIVNSLNGDGSFAVAKGIVNGIDLDALAAKLDRPNSLTDFAAIVDQARAGGQTAIGDVTIPVTIRNGVVQVQNTVIKTQKTQLALNGTVSLPPKTVNLSGQITFVEQRNLPPLTLLVTGLMNAPQKNFDTRSFTSFYAQKATEKLQGKVQDKLNKFLGIPAQQPAATAAPEAALPAASETAPPADASGIAAPTAPTAPVAPTAPSQAPAAEKPKSKDAMKALGSQMLNNFLGGGAK